MLTRFLDELVRLRPKEVEQLLLLFEQKNMYRPNNLKLNEMINELPDLFLPPYTCAITIKNFVCLPFFPVGVAETAHAVRSFAFYFLSFFLNLY